MDSLDDCFSTTIRCEDGNKDCKADSDKGEDDIERTEISSHKRQSEGWREEEKKRT